MKQPLVLQQQARLLRLLERGALEASQASTELRRIAAEARSRSATTHLLSLADRFEALSLAYSAELRQPDAESIHRAAVWGKRVAALGVAGVLTIGSHAAVGGIEKLGADTVDYLIGVVESVAQASESISNGSETLVEVHMVEALVGCSIDGHAHRLRGAYEPGSRHVTISDLWGQLGEPAGQIDVDHLLKHGDVEIGDSTFGVISVWEEDGGDYGLLISGTTVEM